jgi:hypothetical protein
VPPPSLVWVELAPLAFWLDPAVVVEMLLMAGCCYSTSVMSPKVACSRPSVVVERFWVGGRMVLGRVLGQSFISRSRETLTYSSGWHRESCF